MNSVLIEKTFSSDQSLQIVQGDITLEEVDAIVNAANEQLAHGGGVAWAISKKGGAKIQEESDAWIRKHGLVSHAHPAWTSGGTLPAKYVIHAVGPVWGETSDDEGNLSAAVTGSLQVANELKCKSISMPAISTGIFGFPKEHAAEIIFKTVSDYFEQNPDSVLKQVRIVLFDQATLDAFMKQWTE